MKTLKTPAFAALLVLALLIPAASGVLAQEKITVENGQVTIESHDSERVMIFDTEEIGRMIGTSLDLTLEGMGDALAELDDLQLEIKLGQDNQLSVETEDQMFEVNLDLIFNEVSSALEMAFDEMDTESWTVHSHYSDDDFDEEFDQEELEEELEHLKKELQRLQKKLEKTKEL